MSPSNNVEAGNIESLTARFGETSDEAEEEYQNLDMLDIDDIDDHIPDNNTPTSRRSPQPFLSDPSSSLTSRFFAFRWLFPVNRSSDPFT